MNLRNTFRLEPFADSSDPGPQVHDICQRPRTLKDSVPVGNSLLKRGCDRSLRIVNREVDLPPFVELFRCRDAGDLLNRGLRIVGGRGKLLLEERTSTEFCAAHPPMKDGRGSWSRA